MGQSGRWLFQSLLWWIGRVNPRPLGRPQRHDVLVSIFGARGWGNHRALAQWAPGRGGAYRFACVGVRRFMCRFQSLLGWIGRVNIAPGAEAPHAFVFQSLLWWIGRVNLKRADGTVRPANLFQSLLWWIGRVNTWPLLRPNSHVAPVS